MNEILDKGRVKLISLLMAIMVVTLHIGLETFYNMANGTTNYDRILYCLYYYFQHGVCRVAVPYFMFKAGFLYFYNFDGTLSLYLQKTKRRLFTLLIPYVFWNFINWLFTYIVCNNSLFSSYVSNRKSVDANIIEILFLRAGYQPNWFLELLIIFSIILPLLYKAFQNKVFMISTFLICTCVYIYTGNIYAYGYCFYIVGIFFALHHDRDYIKLDRRFLFIAFLITSLIIVLIGFQNRINLVFEILSVLCFWFASPLITNNYRLNLDISFLIYESHEIIFSTVFKLFYLFMPKSNIFAIFNLNLTYIFGFAVSYFLFCIIKRINNRVYCIIGGK